MLVGCSGQEIACGGYHVGVISTSGVVLTWGLGDDGRLGHGDEADQWQPREVYTMPCHAMPCHDMPCHAIQVEALLGSVAMGISCGGRHTAVVLRSGSLLTFGFGEDGRFVCVLTTLALGILWMFAVSGAGAGYHSAT